jgi:hypothetical protein
LVCISRSGRFPQNPPNGEGPKIHKITNSIREASKFKK